MAELERKYEIPSWPCEITIDNEESYDAQLTLQESCDRKHDAQLIIRCPRLGVSSSISLCGGLDFKAAINGSCSMEKRIIMGMMSATCVLDEKTRTNLDAFIGHHLRRCFWNDIDPNAFYSLSKRQKTAILFYELFSRQSDACERMDSLSEHEREHVKIYTFEAFSTGKRRFLLASEESFLTAYRDLSSHQRHVYEIIREGFACRAYFDVEFQRAYNPTIVGEQLTHVLILLIQRKLFQQFSLVVDSSNFIVLDSSSDRKFSQHIIVLIDDPENSAREVLFRDNSAVGRFVRALLMESLSAVRISAATYGNHGLADALASYDSVQTATVSDVFTVHTADDGLDACFVDTSVYSRNRSFRILMSSKFGKTECLSAAVRHHDGSSRVNSR